MSYFDDVNFADDQSGQFYTDSESYGTTFVTNNPPYGGRGKRAGRGIPPLMSGRNGTGPSRGRSMRPGKNIPSLFNATPPRRPLIRTPPQQAYGGGGFDDYGPRPYMGGPNFSPGYGGGRNFGSPMGMRGRQPIIGPRPPIGYFGPQGMFPPRQPTPYSAMSPYFGIQQLPHYIMNVEDEDEEDEPEQTYSSKKRKVKGETAAEDKNDADPSKIFVFQKWRNVSDDEKEEDDEKVGRKSKSSDATDVKMDDDAAAKVEETSGDIFETATDVKSEETATKSVAMEAESKNGQSTGEWRRVEKEKPPAADAAPAADTAPAADAAPAEGEPKPFDLDAMIADAQQNVEDQQVVAKTEEEAVQQAVTQAEEEKVQHLQEIEITIPKDMMKPDYCELCDAQFNNEDSAKLHYIGKRHSQKENQYIRKIYQEKGIDPVRFFYVPKGHSNPPQEKKKPSNVDKKKFRFTCFVCSVSFETERQVDTHVQSMSHAKKVWEYQVKSLGGGGGGPPDRSYGYPRGRSSYGVGASSGSKRFKSEKGEFYCNLCDKAMNSSQQYEMHIASKKHKNKENGDGEDW